jgi:hypothetical protein
MRDFVLITEECSLEADCSLGAGGLGDSCAAAVSRKDEPRQRNATAEQTFLVQTFHRLAGVAAYNHMHLHKVHAEPEGIAGILHRHFGFWFCFSLTWL